MAINEPSDQVPGLSDRLLEEAAVWHARMSDPETTDVRRAEFAGWLAQSPDHARAYAETERLWSALEAPTRRLLADYDASADADGPVIKK